MLYEKTNKAWKWWIAQQCLSGYKWVPKIKMKWVPKVRKEDVHTSISPTIDNASRITNGNDLLTGNRGSDLYIISLQETTSSTLICFMAKATPTQACKKKFIQDKGCSKFKRTAKFASYGLMRSNGVGSINGKKYILVIVDNYSRYTWTFFLRTKDETPEVLKDFLKMIQRNLQAQVNTVRTDRGTEFLNKTLNAYFKEEGIKHQTSTSRTPEQNGVVERRNCTLVEATRMMFLASKLPLDGENLDKMKEKGDPCILVGYSTQSKGYQVYNKRTRLIVEYILDITAIGIKILLNAASITAAHIRVSAAQLVNDASKEVSTAELVSTAYLKEFDLLKWDQQVVSELVALRNFTRRYGSRFYTYGGCIQSSHAQTGRLEVKARSTLMMGIPNEHQLMFNSIKDAKLLLEAVEKRFGGNAATKKTQRNLLKQDKVELEIICMDDLYNNLKVYEPEVKGMSSSSSSTQNMAFMSSSNNNTRSSKEAVNAAHGVTTTSTKVNTAYSTNIDNLSDDIICSFFARMKLTINGNETIGFDKSKVECYNYQKRGHFARECKAPRNQDNKNKESSRRSVPVETSTSTILVSCDGLGGYGWSDQAEEGPNYALMAYSSLSSDSEVSNDSNCLKSFMEAVKLLKSQNDQLLRDLEKSSLMVSGYKTGLKSVEEKLEFYKKNESVYVEKINGLKWDIQIVPPPYIGNFMPPTLDLSFTGLDEFVNKPVVENSKAMSSEEEPKIVRKNDDAPIIEEWVSDDEEEDVPQPKTKKKIVRPSIVKKEFIKSKQQEKSTRKTVKQGNPQMDLQDQGVIDSGCSKHMTGNMSYLTKYKEIDGGYVAVGGNPKGGKITGKSTIKTARTPQQNRVAEGRNKTLIEAAKTMLADSKFPTIFWAEVVNTACYVKNRVSLSNLMVRLMKVSFVGYSLNNKAFRVFNSRTRIVEENLHIRFSENTPNVIGSGPDWLFDIDALTRIMNYEPIVTSTQSNSFVGTKIVVVILQVKLEDPKLFSCRWSKPLSTVDEKKVMKIKRKRIGIKHSIELPFDLNMPALEDYSIFDFSRNDEDDGAEADMNNLDTIIQASSIPTTRIHKDHPLDKVIRDL
ncbi:retrovirus-related pol polyprotein from transposon TNT 1-94 [Tanacetum coccineum]